MRSTVLTGFALSTALLLSGAALGETIEGPPPAEGTTCEGTCTEPGGNGGKWSEGPTTSGPTSTDTYVETTSTSEYNQATVASGGKASDKNQSNFVETTTTTTVVTTSETKGSWINPGENSPKPKSFTETTVTWDSQDTSSSKKHVQPSKP